MLGFNLLATLCDPPRVESPRPPSAPLDLQEIPFSGQISLFGAAAASRLQQKLPDTLLRNSGRPRPRQGPAPELARSAHARQAARRRGRTQGQQQSNSASLQAPRKGPGRRADAACAWQSGAPRACESRRLGSISSIATDSACNYFWSFIYICL